MCKSDCIKEARIGRTLYYTYSNYVSHCHPWNYEDHAFECQIYQWGVEKLFQNSYEAINRELKFYIEYWGNFNIKNKSQLSKAVFLAKYISLDLYDEDLNKIFIIDLITE